MKIFKLVALVLTITYLSTSCYSQIMTSGNYIYKTECLGVDLDGSQTLKAWGNGKNKLDAIEQAKKNAIRDVIFYGISEGKSDCEVKPLVNEVNAQSKYEQYFNNFFANGGEYKNFIKLKDKQLKRKKLGEQKPSRAGVTYGIVVRVLRAELKQKFIIDKIL